MWTEEQLDAIFAKTDGRCHLCTRRKRLCRSAYGDEWEVEHSKAKANGGSDHLNNLFAAHVACNKAKGTRSASEYRAEQGLRGPPLSAARKAEIRSDNAVGAGLLGGLLGAFGGPVGIVAGVVVGAVIGHDADPEEGRYE